MANIPPNIPNISNQDASPKTEQKASQKTESGGRDIEIKDTKVPFFKRVTQLFSSNVANKTASEKPSKLENRVNILEDDEYIIPGKKLTAEQFPNPPNRALPELKKKTESQSESAKVSEPPKKALPKKPLPTLPTRKRAGANAEKPETTPQFRNEMRARERVRDQIDSREREIASLKTVIDQGTKIRKGQTEKEGDREIQQFTSKNSQNILAKLTGKAHIKGKSAESRDTAIMIMEKVRKDFDFCIPLTMRSSSPNEQDQKLLSTFKNLLSSLSKEGSWFQNTIGRDPELKKQFESLGQEINRTFSKKGPLS